MGAPSAAPQQRDYLINSRDPGQYFRFKTSPTQKCES